MSKLKQAFYENHSGSTIAEINRITVAIVVGHILFQLLSRRGLVTAKLDQFSWSFACYVLNILLAITVYSRRHSDLLTLYAVPVLALLILEFRKPPILSTRYQSNARSDKTKSEKESRTKVVYVSVYRATMMLTTCLCILAVDLPIFPRRYAKSETWGTSLMDLGVGSFVFSSGIISSVQQNTVLQGLRQGIIVLGMGITRALMVRTTGYHEHVSEYGVHWNFFITLSLLPPLLPVFRALKTRRIPYIVQGMLVCATYQALLIQTGWQAWIIGATRDSLLTANKEGLSSFIGYIAIFLFGLDTGSLVLSKKTRPALYLVFVSCLFYAAAYYFSVHYMKLRVSRRIANAPYILWVAAHNTSFLVSLGLVQQAAAWKDRRPNDNTADNSKTSILLEKVNHHGLYIFLGANLLTGGINLLLGDTMMTTNIIQGLAIMITYSLLISGAAFLM